jgi:hypothetical protein
LLATGDLLHSLVTPPPTFHVGIDPQGCTAVTFAKLRKVRVTVKNEQ